jgi:hypothetical protein
VTESPWSPSPDARTDGRAGGAPHRLIEVVTVLLLGLATVGSAWSAYQVSRWNGVETDEARASAGFRIDASREHALATQLVAYDASAVSQYGEAVAADNPELQQFLRETIVRPGFRPILAEWQAEIDAGRLPANLLQNEEYLADLFAESDAADDQALAAAARSEEAGSNADNYVQLTLFFASALFFAGITASFNTRFTKLTLLSAAGIILLVAAGLLTGYPVA